MEMGLKESKGSLPVTWEHSLDLDCITSAGRELLQLPKNSAKPPIAPTDKELLQESIPSITLRGHLRKVLRTNQQTHVALRL